MATTVRNLRIREDRAKYLFNLDPNRYVNMCSICIHTYRVAACSDDV
jgi:Pre-mRNA splicing Prp18-interacting factor